MNDDGKTAFRAAQTKRFPEPSRSKRGRGGAGQVSTSKRTSADVVAVEPRTLLPAAETLATSSESLCQRAQSLFLKRELREAMRVAGEAARVEPSQTIFALLASICEGLGDFDKACDFRLLQAFLANDVALWEELLHEFVEQKLFYRASTCLRRLIALETKDKVRYRSLVLQLADLYVGLGETRRSISLLYPLWKASRYRDFEVFAILSSVFFQLGRWHALDQLVMGSLDGVYRHNSTFRKDRKSSTEKVGVDADTRTAMNSAEADGLGGAERRQRRDRRDLFFGGDDDDDEVRPEEEAIDGAVARTQRQNETLVQSPTSQLSPQMGDDDFNFDDNVNDLGFTSSGHVLEQNAAPREDNSSPLAHSVRQQHRGSEIVAEIVAAGRHMCTSGGDVGKRHFLTLVNVELELMVERGQFTQALDLAHKCSSALQCGLLELPPDLLLRCGVAYAHLGDDSTAEDVFTEILHTAPLDMYSDAIFDAAECLMRLAKYEAASRMFEALNRFYLLRERDLEGELAEELKADEELDDNGADTDDSREDRENRRKVRALLQQQKSDFSSARCACLFELGRCHKNLGNVSDAFLTLKEVIVIDPTNVGAAVELAEVYHSIGSDAEAIRILSGAREVGGTIGGDHNGRPHDAPQRIMLDANLTLLLAELMVAASREGATAHGQAHAPAAGSINDQVPPAAASFAQQLLSVAIPLMETTLLRTGDEGDTQSVAAGNSSRRSSVASRRFAPRMTRAASSIVSSSSIADMMNSARGLSSGGMRSSAVGSIATSFRTESHASARILLSRHGAMTSSQVGRSAAHTVGGNKDIVVVKDASNLFRFHRRRAADSKKSSGGASKKENHEKLHLASERWDTGSVGRVEDLDEFESATEIEGDDIMPPQVAFPKADEADAHGHKASTRKRVRFEVDEATAAASTTKSIDVGSSGTDDEHAIPDLETIAASRFGSDPGMAALFVEATQFVTGTDPNNTTTTGEALEAAGFVSEANLIPTPHEVLQLVGKEKMVRVASSVIDAYVILKLYAEGKQYSVKVSQVFSRLMRHHSGKDPFVSPLRLASLRLSLASGDLWNATRVTMQLLRDATTDPNQVWDLLSQVVNSNDRSTILHRLLAESSGHEGGGGGGAETPLLCIVGNQYFRNLSYRHALNLYLIALQRHPNDPLLHCLVLSLLDAAGSWRIK